MLNVTCHDQMDPDLNRTDELQDLPVRSSEDQKLEPVTELLCAWSKLAELHNPNVIFKSQFPDILKLPGKEQRQFRKQCSLP